jgi:hypothetical protein
MDGRMTMVARASPDETNFLKHIAQTVGVVFEASELIVNIRIPTLPAIIHRLNSIPDDGIGLNK